MLVLMGVCCVIKYYCLNMFCLNMIRYTVCTDYCQDITESTRSNILEVIMDIHCCFKPNLQL